MPDTQIHPTGTLAVPADYKVPDSAELLLKNVYAHFDGSGAAGSYLPLVRIISDAGSTVVEAVADTTIAAGASADASWFPHLAAAAAAGGISPDWGFYFLDSVLVPSGSRLDSTWFFGGGSPVLTLHGINPPTVAATGVYTVSAWIQSSDTWTARAVAGARLDVGNPTSFAMRQTGCATPAGVMENFGIQLTAQITAGQIVDVEFENFDTAARNMYSNQVLVQLVSGF